MSKIKLKAEREMLEGLIKKHYKIVSRLFVGARTKEASKQKIMDYEHRICIINWKLNGKQSTQPKPARLGREWLV